MALLAAEVFLLRSKEVDQVEVYDVIKYRLQRCLTVPNLCGFADMTSCQHYQCIYVADDIVKCIHRLDSQGKNAATQWPVNDQPWGLTVNTPHNLLVTCLVVRKIKEFSSLGDLLREITLPDDVIHPNHAIQLTSGQFVVSHRWTSDQVYRVSMITADDRQIVHSYGGQPGSSTGQYNGPCHLAVDSSECVFVVDRDNYRVKLLSPTLCHIRDAVTSDLFKWKPLRLCLNEQSHHLYVAESEFKGERKNMAGRVIVSACNSRVCMPAVVPEKAVAQVSLTTHHYCRCVEANQPDTDLYSSAW